MESALARQSHRDLLKAAKRMTPAQRLKAYVVHSSLMIKMQEAGKRYRKLKIKSQHAK